MSLQHFSATRPGDLFLLGLASTLSTVSGSSRLNGKLMVILTDIRHALWPKDLNSDMVLIMEILLALWSSLLPFVCSCPWLYPKGGISVSLIYKMHFYMAFLKKRYSCGNLQALKIPLILVICVDLTRLSMDLSRLLMHGMLAGPGRQNPGPCAKFKYGPYFTT
jgi:hypothetical protein